MNARKINDQCAALMGRIGWPGMLGFNPADGNFWRYGQPCYDIDFIEALIRCHIMDWLASNGWDICLTGGAEEIRAAPPTNRMLAIVRLDKFPTPLHALVAVGMKATEVAHV